MPAKTLSPGDPATAVGANPAGPVNDLASFTFNRQMELTPNLDCLAEPTNCPNTPASGLDGHVDARQIMDVGVMNGNIPAPLMAIDEDDEFFLTLTNVGMIVARLVRAPSLRLSECLCVL
jgi:hypothetical protein